LLSLRFGFFATDIGFEAVDPPCGAIKRPPHSLERLITSSSRGNRRMAVLTVKVLLALVGKPFALIREKLALIGMTFAFVGNNLALIGTTLAFVGDSFALVSEPLSLIRSSLLLG
jgi:hypothetical protein